MTYPTKDLYPGQIKKSLNSGPSKQILQFKMGKRLGHFLKEDIPMANKEQKYISHHQLFGKYKLKPQRDFTTHQ